MDHRFTTIATLCFALPACKGELVCPGPTYETDAGICECNPGFAWNKDGTACVELDGGTSATTAEAGLQRDAGLDARSRVPVDRDDSGELEPEDGGETPDVNAAEQLDASTTDGTAPDVGPSCVPAIETCNGKDDDCDDQVDEDVSEAPIGESCSNGGSGVCSAMGKQVCLNGAIVCNAPPPMPTAELCDGIDNDCKNGVDDTFPTKGMACTVGKGDCANSGVSECDSADPTRLRCSAAEKPRTCGNSCTPMPETECAGGTGDCKVVRAWVCDAVASTWQCPAVAKTPITWYPDCDGDGFAQVEGGSASCEKPTKAGCLSWLAAAPSGSNADCDDGNARRHPGAKPIVNPLAFVAGDVSSFDGDTNCDGTAQPSSVFDIATVNDGVVYQSGVSYRKCFDEEGCGIGGGPTSCYKLLGPNGTLGASEYTVLPCGYSGVQVIDKSGCPNGLSAYSYRARLVCQ